MRVRPELGYDAPPHAGAGSTGLEPEGAGTREVVDPRIQVREQTTAGTDVEHEVGVAHPTERNR